MNFRIYQHSGFLVEGSTNPIKYSTKCPCTCPSASQSFGESFVVPTYPSLFLSLSLTDGHVTPSNFPTEKCKFLCRIPPKASIKQSNSGRITCNLCICAELKQEQHFRVQLTNAIIHLCSRTHMPSHTCNIQNVLYD